MPSQHIPRIVLKKFMPRNGMKWLGRRQVTHSKRKYNEVVRALEAMGVPKLKTEIQIELCNLFEAAVAVLHSKTDCDGRGLSNHLTFELWELIKEIPDYSELARRLRVGTLISLMKEITLSRARYCVDPETGEIHEDPPNLPPLAQFVDWFALTWQQSARPITVWDWERVEQFEWTAEDEDDDDDDDDDDSLEGDLEAEPADDLAAAASADDAAASAAAVAALVTSASTTTITEGVQRMTLDPASKVPEAGEEGVDVEEESLGKTEDDGMGLPAGTRWRIMRDIRSAQFSRMHCHRQVQPLNTWAQ
ncbi:hypothetical protein VTJ04DRAFT_10843 [Mycothermus thermophilus]|uniref:uncharacterized protein n=1 Tax=Humicola insolens TaxID=85995 RepID=UPI0037449BBB